MLLQEWIVNLKIIVEHFKEHQKVPYHNNNIKRRSSLIIFPFICGLCYCWSVLWRTMCCQASYPTETGSTTTNIYSEKSDRMINIYIDETCKRTKCIPIPHLNNASNYELRQFANILSDLKIIYKVDKFTKEYYILTDCVIKSLCKPDDICIPEFALKIISKYDIIIERLLDKRSSYTNVILSDDEMLSEEIIEAATASIYDSPTVTPRSTCTPSISQPS